jgi:hypothetical protein
MMLLYRGHPVTSFVELVVAGLIYAALYVALVAATRLVTLDDVRSLLGRKPV